MNFKILFLIFLFLPVLGFSLTKDAETAAITNKMLDDQFETMSKGMTPEMKVKLKKSIEESKRIMKEYEALTPEQRKKKEEENEKMLNSADAKNNIKKNFDSLSAEDKEMMKIMLQNASNQFNALKDPNSPERKKMLQDIPRASKRSPEEIVNAKVSSAYELGNVAYEIGESGGTITNSEKMLNQIFQHANSDSATFRSVSIALAKASNPFKSEDELLKKILNSPKMNIEGVNDVVNSYFSFKKLGLTSAITFQNIVATKLNDVEAVGKVSYAIVKTKNPLVEKDHLLLQLIDSPNATAEILVRVGISLEYAEETITGVEKVFEKIIDSPLMDLKKIKKIADSLSKTKSIVKGKEKLYDKISAKDPFTQLSKKLEKSDMPAEEAEKLMLEEIKSASITPEKLQRIGLILGNAKVPFPHTESILMQILISPVANANSLGGVAYVISRPNIEIKNTEKILQEIIDSPKSNAWTLSSVVTAVRRSKVKVKDPTKMVMQIYTFPKTDARVYSEILNYISWADTPLPNPGKIIQEIMNSPIKDENLQRNVIEALRRSKTPIDGAGNLFQQILNSSNLDGDKLGAVALAMSEVQYRVEGIDKMLIQMASMPLTDEKTLERIRLAAKNKNIGIKDSINLLLQLDKIKK